MQSQLVRPTHFDLDLLDYQLLRHLAYAPFGAASVGESFATVAAIRSDGETPESWVRHFGALGERLRVHAAELEDAGRRLAARDTAFRAWNALRAAEFYVREQGSPAMRALYEASRAAFDQGCRLSPFRSEALELPCGAHTLPGLFFAAGPGPRPLVIFNGGGDGSGEELFFLCGGPLALERGLHVLVFHGPGHRGALHRNPALTFRYDWESVLMPIVDAMLARADVDGRVGVYGVSLGGYFGPRAACFDPRIAAVAANGLIPSYRRFWNETIAERAPSALHAFAERRLASMGPDAWDQVASFFSLKGPFFECIVSMLLWTNGVKTIGEFIGRIEKAHLDGLAPQLRCPLLVVHGEGEGEAAIEGARRWLREVPGRVDLEVLGAQFGADAHCGMGNLVHTNGLVLDWMAARLAEASPVS